MSNGNVFYFFQSLCHLSPLPGFTDKPSNIMVNEGNESRQTASFLFSGSKHLVIHMFLPDTCCQLEEAPLYSYFPKCALQSLGMVAMLPRLALNSSGLQ